MGTGVDDMPTMSPTHYPTKVQQDPNNIGSTCKYDYTNKAGNAVTFERPVGWVGAGPGKDFCNIWKCEKAPSGQDSTDFSKGTAVAHFKKQVRKCNIQDRETSVSFCSHTTCSFEAISLSDDTNVIKVRSDHREEVGGYHKCGLAEHGMQGGHQDNEMGSHLNDAAHGFSNPDARPACDCICYAMDDTGLTPTATLTFLRIFAFPPLAAKT